MFDIEKLQDLTKSFCLGLDWDTPACVAFNPMNDNELVKLIHANTEEGDIKAPVLLLNAKVIYDEQWREKLKKALREHAAGFELLNEDNEKKLGLEGILVLLFGEFTKLDSFDTDIDYTITMQIFNQFMPYNLGGN